MSPILGVVASSKTGRLLLPGSYESIQTIPLSSNQQSIEFTNIPQTYKHLEIRAIIRDTYPNTYPGTVVYMNGVGNGTFNYLSGDGNGGTGAIGGAVSAYAGNAAGGDTPAGNYMCWISRIPDYTDTSKQKLMTNLNGNSANTYSNHIAFWVWSPGFTAAVTSIRIFEGDNNFKLMPGSHFALYGIKG